MYKDYYLQVKDVADKIRSNPSENPLPTSGNGFMRPKVEVEAPEAESFHDVMLHYMQGIRASSVEASFEDRLPIPKDDKGLQSAVNAIGQIESSNNYQALGPVMKKGSYKGDRAYGKYQVMGANIGPWSREVLGKEITKEEFLSNPRYQDMIVAHKMAQSKEKYGTWEDAASVWFSGRPVKKAGNASDGYNTVPQYVEKFRKAMS